jgi:hypothetical protein
MNLPAGSWPLRKYTALSLLRCCRYELEAQQQSASAVRWPHAWTLYACAKMRSHTGLISMDHQARCCGLCLCCSEVNRGGLQGLYRILLEDSGPWFAAALRHISSEYRWHAVLAWYLYYGSARWCCL